MRIMTLQDQPVRQLFAINRVTVLKVATPNWAKLDKN